MLGFYIVFSVLFLLSGFIVGELLYKSNLTRMYRIATMEKKRFVEGEIEANQSFSENVK